MMSPAPLVRPVDSTLIRRTAVSLGIDLSPTSTDFRQAMAYF